MQDYVETTLESPAVEDDTPAPERARWLCCHVCRTCIVLATARMSFDGGHTHRFINPGGIAFQIALFDDAPGCSHEGEPTEYFSWFPGYTWRIAACSQCSAHLGWSFQCIGPPGAGEPAGFHGLILGRLRPQS
ncbi:MAG: cereblon family protein [Gammaproteobacteria bacterium]